MAFEKSLWVWFRKGLRGQPGLHMCRIENSVGAGNPDVEGCYDSVCFQIELKRVKKLDKDENVKIDFRPMQQPWLKKRWSVGGLSWLLIALGEGKNTRRFLIRGCDVDGLENCHISTLEEISVIAEDARPVDILNTACMLFFS